MVEVEDLPAPVRRPLVVVTLWVALTTGLLEAAGSVWMMKLGRRPGSWYDLFWASPLFDLVMFGVTGFVLASVARKVGRPALPVVLPVYLFLTASILLGLALPYQVHIVALLALSAGLGFQGSRLIVRRSDAVLRFWARTLPLVVGAAVVAGLAILAGRPLRERIEIGRLTTAEPRAPDVVLIVVDALRADHLAPWGYVRDTSPNLTRLATEGTLFDAAFSTAPYTGPSHASLLTGLYASEHGLQWIERRPVLSDDHPTISGALQELGYRTAAISGNRFWFTREQGFGRGFHRFVENYHTFGDALVRTAYGRKIDEWLVPRLFEDYPWRLKSEEVTDRALAWAAAGNGAGPFFLMLNYFDVHDPYFPPDPYRRWYSTKDDPGGVLNSFLQRYHAELTSEELQDEIDAYDGSIRYVDAEIGRLVDALREGGRDRDLVVIVTADHGEAFGEHGAYIHANALYLEETHVPLIVWSPGRVPAGVRRSEPVSIASVPASILELIGASENEAFRVPSFVSQPSVSDASEQARAFSEMEHWDWNLDTSPSHYGAIQAVIDSEFHLIQNDSLGVELFRWREDPLEATNLISSDSLNATADELQQILRSRLPRGTSVGPSR